MDNLIIHIYKIRKGTKTQDLSGHKGPILSIIKIDPKDMHM